MLHRTVRLTVTLNDLGRYLNISSPISRKILHLSAIMWL